VRFRIEQVFEVPPPAVEAAYFDPAFLSELAGLPKIGRAELLDQKVDGNLVHQRVRYAFVGELSGAVRAVVDPARLTWVEESVLDQATHRITWRIVPDHYPDRLTCAATSVISADAVGTRRVTDGDLKVSFPLVAGRVERAIVGGLQEHAEAEVAALERFVNQGG
jgi:uncharacterized protein DUF2505